MWETVMQMRSYWNSQPRTSSVKIAIRRSYSDPWLDLLFIIWSRGQTTCHHSLGICAEQIPFSWYDLALSLCGPENADTCVMLHTVHVPPNNLNKILIGTVDTDLNQDRFRSLWAILDYTIRGLRDMLWTNQMLSENICIGIHRHT